MSLLRHTTIISTSGTMKRDCPLIRQGTGNNCDQMLTALSPVSTGDIHWPDRILLYYDTPSIHQITGVLVLFSQPNDFPMSAHWESFTGQMIRPGVLSLSLVWCFIALPVERGNKRAALVAAMKAVAVAMMGVATHVAW